MRPDPSFALSTERFEPMLELLALSPDHLIASMVVLSGLMFVNDLVRSTLMVTFTRSVVNHVAVVVLTLLPAMLLGAVLLLAGYRHPERALLNFGLALVLYLPWLAGGALTRLARKDTEGADVGFVVVGLFITVPCGLIALGF